MMEMDLISVYIPILYAMIVMLEDKKAETMIEKMIAAHKREGRNVTLIRVDGEEEIVQQKKTRIPNDQTRNASGQNGEAKSRNPNTG